MNPIIRFAAIALVAAAAVGGAIYVLRPASSVGPPTPTIEGTWEATFTRQQMLAAGLADAGEDYPGNYGHFVYAFQGGTFSLVQLDGPHGAGGGTYVLDGAAITLHQTNGETFAAIPFTVTDTSLTFGKPAPVGLRTVPWTRIRAAVPVASAAAVDRASYRAARNAICHGGEAARQAFDARIGTGLYDPATPAAQRAAKAAALREFTDWAEGILDQLASLPVPSDMAVDASVSVSASRGSLQLIRQELQLIQAGKLAEAEAMDVSTDPISREVESFESKYGLASCPV